MIGMTKEKKPIEATKGEAVGEVVSIALNAVPVAGGVLSGIASGIIQKRQNRRLNDFLIVLAQNLNELEARLNAEFMESESFQDLAEDIFSKAAETRQQEKLDAFRAIFLNTVSAYQPSYDEAAEIADLVNGWQSRHEVMLKILADPIAADERAGNVVGRGGGITTSISAIMRKLLPDWDEDQIDRTWQELYSAQLHRTPGTKTMMTDQGIHQLENRLEEFGKKVASYIHNPIPEQ